MAERASGRAEKAARRPGRWLGAVRRAASDAASAAPSKRTLALTTSSRSSENENLTASVSTPAYCDRSPEARLVPPCRRKALSFTVSVTLRASAATRATVCVCCAGGRQTRLHSLDWAARAVPSLSDPTAAKKRSGGTDRKASRPASIVFMISLASPVAASATLLLASGAAGFALRPRTTGMRLSAKVTEASWKVGPRSEAEGSAMVGSAPAASAGGLTRSVADSMLDRTANLAPSSAAARDAARGSLIRSTEGSCRARLCGGASRRAAECSLIMQVSAPADLDLSLPQQLQRCCASRSSPWRCRALPSAASSLHHPLCPHGAAWRRQHRSLPSRCQTTG